MKNGKQTKIRPIISVGDMAKALDHSRARFYQLQKENIYPPPIYDIQTKRPFYDAHLQKVCHEIRETGIGWNGRYILFYSQRKNICENSPKSSALRKSKINSEHQELAQTLKQMGLDVSGSQVSQAVQELYPKGIENNEDTGIVIRELFCRFKK